MRLAFTQLRDAGLGDDLRGVFIRQRHSLLSTYVQAKVDRFPDSVERFFPGRSLADASRNRGTFNNPNPVFVPINNDMKLHVVSPRTNAIVAHKRTWANNAKPIFTRVLLTN